MQLSLFFSFFFILFIINVGIQVSLCVPQLISHVLKLTII
jgi:hypothetical protein